MIRKSDIAIATDTKTLVRTIQDKPRLMEFVACKTVGEYNRNKEKIKKFYLDEQLTKDSEKKQQADTQRDIEDTTTNDEQPGPSNASTETNQKRAQRKPNTKSPTKRANQQGRPTIKKPYHLKPSPNEPHSHSQS